MKYNCEHCNYSTDDKGNWSKHKKSQKHIKNSNKDNKTTTINTATSQPHLTHTIINTQRKLEEVKKNTESNKKKVYKCTYCENNFSRLDSLNRHLKCCSEKKSKHGLLEMEYEKYKVEKENEIKIKLLEEKLKSSEDKLKSYENHIETLKHENKFQKQLIESAGGMIKKSMNTMSYLLLNYNEAPQLMSLPDYSIISKNTDALIENLIHYHKKGKFDKYIGDFLVQQYKKDDPKLQAVWSSDIERLNYFVRELLNNPLQDKNDKNLESKEKSKKSLSWLIDKKGIKVRRNIIDPLLDYIHDIGVKYLNEKNKEIDNLETDQATKLISKMQEIGEINCQIKNKTISNNINKYIAPHFFLNRE